MMASCVLSLFLRRLFNSLGVGVQWKKNAVLNLLKFILSSGCAKQNHLDPSKVFFKVKMYLDLHNCI